MRRAVLPLVLLFVAACSSSPPAGIPPPPPGPPGPGGRTLFSNTPISQGGGTLVYTKAGDPLSGLTLTVPAGAYHMAVPWTIVADSSIVVPLPAGFSQVGPVLVITNGQDYADSVMTLTMPMQVASGTAVAPFYFDPATKTLEGIPLVARTATSATLATRHFSGDFIAMPGSGSQSGHLRGSLRSGFGSVVVVWVQIPPALLIGTWSSTFRPGVDDWEFTNYGDYIAPGGDCEGMSITAMYYHYFFRLGPSPQPGLYHQFDQSLANQWDNVQGIRFAGSVQGDYHDRFVQGFNQVATLTASGLANGADPRVLTSDWILLTLKLTGHPVLMSLKGVRGGHAVVAYAATSDGALTTVSFADPNEPGDATRTMTFSQGMLLPVSLSANADVTPSPYSTAYAMGVSAQVPLNQVSSRWQEFIGHTAGSDRYPVTYHFEIFDELNNIWIPLQSTFQSTSSNVKVRFICPSCSVKTGYDPNSPDLQNAALWDGTGAQRLDANGFLANVTTTTTFVAVGNALSPYPDGTDGFVDAKSFTFIRGSFFVLASSTTPNAASPVSFLTHHGGIAGPGSTFTWDFGDGSVAAVVAAPDSSATHVYQAAGTYTVSVDLHDARGTLQGHATITEIVIAPVNFAIRPAPLDVNPGILITLTATPNGTPPVNASYTWTFGDGSPPVTLTDITTVQHTWAKVNSYPVSLNVSFVVGGMPLASQSTSTACVGTAWRLTSFAQSAFTTPSPGTPADYVTALNDLYVYLDQVHTTPSDGLLYLGDGTFFVNQGVYFQVAPPGTGAAGLCWLRAGYTAQVAWLGGFGSSYSNTGTLDAGSIAGVAYGNLPFGPAPSPGVNLGFTNSINAVKSGTTLTGTMKFGSNSYSGSRTYTFTATRLAP